jgi:hypothetical protein
MKLKESMFKDSLLLNSTLPLTKLQLITVEIELLMDLLNSLKKKLRKILIIIIFSVAWVDDEPASETKEDL